MRPLEIKDIMDRLPHRPPFLLLDRVVSWGPKKVMAIKNITINEPYFVGHFPNEPVVPGVLLGETMAQASAFLSDPDVIEDQSDSGLPSMGSMAFLAAMNIKIMRPAVPGDQLIVNVKLVRRLGALKKIKGQISVDRKPIATADFSVANAPDT